MRLRYVAIACLVFAAGFGCRSAEKESSNDLDTDVPLRLSPAEGTEEVSEESIPTMLWSPSRRKSTAGYYFLVAEYMALGGEFQEALPLFETSYNLDPNSFLGAKLIAAEASVGQLDKALPEARKMVLLYPREAQLHFLYGQLLGRHGFYTDSEKELEQAIDLGPEKEEYYLELANLHQRNEQVPKAIVVIKDMVQKIPSSVVGWVRLAKLYLASSQKDKALEPARRAYEMQNENPENVLVYALALEMNGQPKRAIALYEQLYLLNPSSEELVARMIELYRSVGDLNESLKLLNELSELPGGSRPGIQLQRAIILWELEKFAEAAKILNTLAIDYPENDRLRYMSGLGQEKMQDYDRAIQTYESIPRESQFYLQAKFRTVIVLKQQKKFDQALNLIAELEKAEGTNPDVYVLGSSILSNNNKNEEAVDLVARGYAKNPETHRLLFLKGIYQEKLGQADAAMATMKQVIEVDPANSAAYNFLGYMYAERGIQLEEAEKLVKKALEIKPDDGYYIDSLAWVYFQRGQYKKALPLLNRALEKVPDEGVVMEHLGDVYGKLGDQVAALEQYRRALKSKLEERDRPRVQKKLHDLEVRLGKKYGGVTGEKR